MSLFNTRIAKLQDLVIAWNTLFLSLVQSGSSTSLLLLFAISMYRTTSITDLSTVDAKLKEMELQLHSIKDRLRDETLAIPKAKVPLSLSLSLSLSLRFNFSMVGFWIRVLFIKLGIYIYIYIFKWYQNFEIQAVLFVWKTELVVN